MQLKQSIALSAILHSDSTETLSLAFHIGNVGEVIVGSLPLQLMETRVRKQTKVHY